MYAIALFSKNFQNQGKDTHINNCINNCVHFMNIRKRFYEYNKKPKATGTEIKDLLHIKKVKM